MFGFAQTELASERVSQIFQGHVDGIKEDSSFTAAAFSKHVSDMMAEVHKVVGSERLQPRRLVKLPYRKVLLSYRVSSLVDEATVRLQARVKEAALALKLIDPLLCENELADAPRKLLKDP
jgi:hypothetical protein